MIDYDLLTTKNLDSALDYLDKLENVKLIAGGTDLLVDIRKNVSRLHKIDYVLDISNIEELKGIQKKEKYIEIGSMVTHNMLTKNIVINENFPILVDAAKSIGSYLIRNRGTVGGNINNAATCADLVPALMALRAEVVLKSLSNQRIVPIENFVIGPNRTDLKKNEMVTYVRIPLLGGNYYGCFQKIGRRNALSISRLTMVLLTKIEEETFRDVRLVSGAVTPYPQMFTKTIEVIEGQPIKKINIEDIGNAVSEEMVSITGERWSTPYKRPVIASLIKRALVNVIKEASDNE